jgi:pimeloyl-ACP methyl ester carboxylesterase
VLFHGLTNCPQQFETFAKQLHAGGDNVYVPRLPRHGYADRTTRAIGAITAAEIEAAATDAAEHARGLGDRVAVAGLSLGGTLALRLAQTGAVENAIAIAPFLMVPALPRGPGTLFMRALDVLPDVFMWWDPRLKERMMPDYAYPGFWTHCLAECVFAGDAVFALAARRAPAAPHCTIVVNAHDPAINNAAARDLARVWRANGAAYDYAVWDDLGKRHDVIDPTTFPDAARLVYPRLAALLDKIAP